MKMQPWVLIGVALPLAFLNPAVRSLFDTAIAGEGQQGSYIEELVTRSQQFLLGKQRDPARAVVLLTEAAKAGNPTAMRILAGLYAKGDGVPVDFDEAAKLLEKAVPVAGDDTAAVWAELGDLYHNADPAHRDNVRAAAAYQHAVDLGNISVSFTLGQMLASGDGVAADFDRAKDLLVKTVA